MFQPVEGERRVSMKMRRGESSQRQFRPPDAFCGFCNYRGGLEGEARVRSSSGVIMVIIVIIPLRGDNNSIHPLRRFLYIWV